MLFCVGVPHKTRAARRTPTSTTRAASSLRQFNKSAQSNQQDLIGKMEPNRQEKPARGEEVLLGENAQRRRNVVKYRREVCLARLEKRLGNGVVRAANKRTLYALALVRPVTMVGGLILLVLRVPVARRASVIPHPLGMRRIACLGTIVRVVRAATHDEVNRKNHGTQTVQQTGHRNPQFRRNPHRQSDYTILSQSGYTSFEVCENGLRVAFPARTAIHLTHESGVISADFALRTRRPEGCRTAGSLRLLPRSREGHAGHRGARGSSENRFVALSAASGS